MSEAQEVATRVLREHRKTLDEVIRLLLEREVVDGDEVRRLLAADPPSIVRSA
jgi:ATP-dependent Zn protease